MIPHPYSEQLARLHQEDLAAAADAAHLKRLGRRHRRSRVRSLFRRLVTHWGGRRPTRPRQARPAPVQGAPVEPV
jgi:hypothetical protein